MSQADGPPTVNRVIDGPLFVIGFSLEFADLVATGKKCQTGRVERRDGRRAYVGQRLRGYAGLRQPNPRWLGDFRCTHVCDAKLTPSHLFIDPRILGSFLDDASNSYHAFAVADGFANIGEMSDWFVNTHRKRLREDGELRLVFYRWRPIVLPGA